MVENIIMNELTYETFHKEELLEIGLLYQIIKLHFQVLEIYPQDQYLFLEYVTDQETKYQTQQQQVVLV